MLEYVPFVKPFICNQSKRSQIIKTAVLALATALTSTSYIDYLDKKDTFIKLEDEYERMRDVDGIDFVDTRGNMSLAHDNYVSAYKKLNWIYFPSLGITYVFTIVF